MQGKLWATSEYIEGKHKKTKGIAFSLVWVNHRRGSDRFDECIVYAALYDNYCSGYRNIGYAVEDDWIEVKGSQIPSDFHADRDRVHNGRIKIHH